MITVSDGVIHALTDSLHIGPGPIGIDTEGSVERPWCISAATDPSSSSVVLMGGEVTVDPDALFVLHNALHDTRVLRSMGIDHPHFTDTMACAWLLGFEFIGLKKLSGLLLGKDRDSYKDVMEEANERIMREWLESRLADFPRWPGAKPPEMEKKLRLIDRMLAKADGKITLRDRWKNCKANEWMQEERLIDAPPEATMDDLPIGQAVAYAGEDAVDTIALYPILDKRIDELGLRDVLNVDLAVLPMIVRMQDVGIKADPEHFHDLSILYADELEVIAGKIRDMGGPDNPGSDEIKDWLFGTLKLPSKKKTKGGDPSTDKKAMDALLKNPKIVGKGRQGLELLMEWRQVRKLKTTYADPMPDFIKADGRLHPNLSLTTVPTGRLAAKEPNVLAFPKHSERGKLIRMGFMADEGCELGAWDLSQIELRVLAIDSGDKRMLAQFASGHDFHLMGAAERYGKKPEDVTKHERFTQKAINFGIVMGITEFGLLDQFLKNGQTRGVQTVWNHVLECFEEKVVPWTEEACREQLESWRDAYPQATAYLRAKHAEARRYGYVRDMWQRLRYIEDIDSDNAYFRAEAERIAQATPIQSGAQGVVKRWMIDVWEGMQELWAQGIYCECLLQTHDELLFEYTKSEREVVGAMVQKALDKRQRYSIPITMEGSFGQRWSDL